jgi:predicted anti-sigma-YlaC factor YlaD
MLDDVLFCPGSGVPCSDVMCSAYRRWVDEHGDQARQLQAVQEGRQQAEDRVAELSTQLEQEQQQLAQQRERCALLTTCFCSYAFGPSSWLCVKHAVGTQHGDELCMG